ESPVYVIAIGARDRAPAGRPAGPVVYPTPLPLADGFAASPVASRRACEPADSRGGLRPTLSGRAVGRRGAALVYSSASSPATSGSINVGADGAPARGSLAARTDGVRARGAGSSSAAGRVRDERPPPPPGLAARRQARNAASVS